MRDDVTDDSMTVCAGVDRERHVLTSTGNQLRVTFHLHDANKQKFLLQLQGYHECILTGTYKNRCLYMYDVMVA